MLRFAIFVLLVNISFLKGSPIEKKDGIPESEVDRAIASAEMPGVQSFSEYPYRPYGMYGMPFGTPYGMPYGYQMGNGIGEEQGQIMEEEPTIMEPAMAEEETEPSEEETVIEETEPSEEETVIEETEPLQEEPVEEETVVVKEDEQ